LKDEMDFEKKEAQKVAENSDFAERGPAQLSLLIDYH